MRAEGSKNISPWFSRFISDSITWDMLLENDGNFGEVINGTDIRLDSTHLSLYDILVQAPSRAGFCTGNWSSLSLPVQTCIMLWVCSYWEMSVCLSVTPFWLCSHHRIIMKFSGVITNDQSKVHAKGQGQRSKVKVTEVTTQLNRFRTVTPVWIDIWWWNDAYTGSLMLLRRGALLFFKVIRQISRSHGSNNHRIWPRLGVSGL